MVIITLHNHATGCIQDQSLFLMQFHFSFDFFSWKGRHPCYLSKLSPITDQ